jgi:signal transduction histidine kinase
MKPLISFFASPPRRLWPLLLAWLLCCLLWGAWLIHAERETTRDDFETQSRILHRLLTQRAEQHEALFASLTALEPSLAEMSQAVASKTLQSFVASVIASYPQVLAVRRYLPHANGKWFDESGAMVSPALAGALDEASRRGQSVLPNPQGFLVLRKGNRSVWLLEIGTARLLGEDELPGAGISLRLAPDNGPVLWQRAVQDRAWPGMTRLHFEKHLAVRSQPYLMTTERAPMPAHLPWSRFGWGAAVLLALCAAAAWAIGQYRQRVLTQRQLALAHASRINAMGEVAAGMAHELNQPLAAILSSAQAAMRWLDDEPPETGEARSAVKAAVAQAKRAGEILQRLRSFISPQAGVSEVVDLNEVARGALLLINESLQRRNVQISTRLAEGLPRVRGERVAFEQVVVNLLLNAADAIEAQDKSTRQVQVETSHDGDRVVLSVRDSGPGFTPEVRARLFEPFFTTKREGMGLGLSICEHIVEQAGGDLVADNADGGGAVVRMSLPAGDKRGTQT